MGNTTIYQRPATYKFSLKQSCITMDPGSFWDGLLRFHYLNWAPGTGGLELAFIGRRIADDGMKYWTALQNKAATLLLQKQCLLCGDGIGIYADAIVLCLDEASSMGPFLSPVIGWNTNEFCTQLADRYAWDN